MILVKLERTGLQNIDYNLYSNTGDGTLLFVEQWESVEILGSHLQTDHFIRFGDNIKDLVAADLIIDVFDANAVDL